MSDFCSYVDHSLPNLQDERSRGSLKCRHGWHQTTISWTTSCGLANLSPQPPTNAPSPSMVQSPQCPAPAGPEFAVRSNSKSSAAIPSVHQCGGEGFATRRGTAWHWDLGGRMRSRKERVMVCTCRKLCLVFRPCTVIHWLIISG